MPGQRAVNKPGGETGDAGLIPPMRGIIIADVESYPCNHEGESEVGHDRTDIATGRILLAEGVETYDDVVVDAGDMFDRQQ